MKETSNLSIDVIVVVYDYVTTFGVLEFCFRWIKELLGTNHWKKEISSIANSVFRSRGVDCTQNWLSLLILQIPYSFTYSSNSRGESENIIAMMCPTENSMLSWIGCNARGKSRYQATLNQRCYSIKLRPRLESRTSFTRGVVERKRCLHFSD